MSVKQLGRGLVSPIIYIDDIYENVIQYPKFNGYKKAIIDYARTHPKYDPFISDHRLFVLFENDPSFDKYMIDNETVCSNKYPAFTVELNWDKILNNSNKKYDSNKKYVEIAELIENYERQVIKKIGGCIGEGRY